tara:strand:- start:138 stop:572 length:435 start_codon:yes stop_codon:yes gene_type:complete
MNRLTYIAFLSLSVSFLFSDYTGVSGNKDKGEAFSFQKKRKGVVKKANQNSDLKVELMELEEEFKLDYDEIKVHYKEKILALKDMQKSDVKSLKSNYNNRRKAIYKKYGVKPPKKSEGHTMEGTDVYKPKKKERVHSPVKKSIK